MGAVLCIAGWSQNTLGSWKITLHENSCSRAVPLELSQMIAKYSIPPVCHRNHHMGLLRASNVASVAEERNFYFFFFFLVFLGLHPWHIEVPRLGVDSELELLAYTTAAATQNPSHVCDLHHGSWQCWILTPLSKARD